MIEFDFIDWDDEDNPRGNVQHIAEHGVTTDEVEEVLSDPDAALGRSRSTGRPVAFGWTSTGKHLIVVFEISDTGAVVILRPITSYEVAPPS